MTCIKHIDPYNIEFNLDEEGPKTDREKAAIFLEMIADILTIKECIDSDYEGKFIDHQYKYLAKMYDSIPEPYIH